MTICQFPDEINRDHGKPVWRCFGCKAESGLHWHHGLSVAVCDKPECGKAWDDMVAAQEQADADFADYCAENGYPGYHA